MKDALFKQLARELSPAEEAEFSRQLAAAYREHEAGEQRPELERIAQLVQARLRQDTSAESDTPRARPGDSPPPTTAGC